MGHEAERDDRDSPWKEALERYLEHFLRLLFPVAHAAVDWARGWEALDAELQQVVRDAETGRRLADKLFRVWLVDGSERWVLIHVEVQGQVDDELPERAFVYSPIGTIVGEDDQASDASLSSRSTPTRLPWSSSLTWPRCGRGRTPRRG